MQKYHLCCGYIINRAFHTKKLLKWNGLVFHWCLYSINITLHGRLEIRNFSSRVEKIFQHSKRNFVSPRGHVISSIYCKAQKRVKEISIVYKQPKEQPQKFTQTGYSTKTSSDRLIVLCVHGMHTTKYWASWGFLCLRDAGRRGNKITVRGKLIWVWLVYIWCITKGLGLRISPGRLLWAWWLIVEK